MPAESSISTLCPRVLIPLASFDTASDVCRALNLGTNIFVIGEGNKPMISLPKGKGIKLTIVEELEKRKEN
jgi:hypothetical protein